MSVHKMPGAEVSRRLLEEAPPPDEPPEDDTDVAERVSDHEIARELGRLRVRDAARRAFVAEQAGYVDPPSPVALPELLAEPDEATDYRVEGLWPAGGRVILAAQYKSGKTTLVGNLVRCLVDGDPFLGCHEVTPPAGQVVILDTEMPRGKLRAWLRYQGIVAPQRVTVVPLRGRVASFNLLDPVVRADWVTTLRDLGTSVLILDCLRPVLDSLGLDENHDTGRVLVALDELAEAAGVAEFAIVHHMGHTGERSRGDSDCVTGPTWSGASSARTTIQAPRGFSPPTAEMSTCPRPRSTSTPPPGASAPRGVPVRPPSPGLRCARCSICSARQATPGCPAARSRRPSYRPATLVLMSAPP
ncbi:MAG: AAA family ATPase [Pseudonocardiaceae bacterium]